MWTLACISSCEICDSVECDSCGMGVTGMAWFSKPHSKGYLRDGLANYARVSVFVWGENPEGQFYLLIYLCV